MLATALLVFAGGPANGQWLEKLSRQRPATLMNDYAGAISADARRAIEAALQELNAKASAAMAVVVLPSLGDENLEDLANRLFQAWGIGQACKNNGLSLLIGLQDRKVRLEVGYGLEPTLTDAKTGRIIDQNIVPAFRRGQYADGILGCISAVGRELGVDLGERPRVGAQGEGPRASPLFSLLVLIVMVVLFIRHPFLMFFLMSNMGRGGSPGGGFGRGSGGFGGGLSGGGGASRGW